MLLDQLADHYRLNLVIPEIAQQVEEVSGKGIDFRPTPKLEVRARTKMARQKMRRHVILFNPKERPHLSHILAHECARILRMFEIPPEERQVPASTPRTLRVARKEIRGEAQFLPRHLRDEMIDMWIHGLITQVTSQPVDVRIEEWINDNYPSLRQDQGQSLRAEIRTITANLPPEVKRMTAATIFRCSNALNYAYLDHIKDILGRSFESTFIGNPDTVALGRFLSRIMDDDVAPDKEIVDRCAKTIQVNDWFIWADFEDIPPSYHVN